jgi:hypothetical protein
MQTKGAFDRCSHADVRDYKVVMVGGKSKFCSHKKIHAWTFEEENMNFLLQE